MAAIQNVKPRSIPWTHRPIHTPDPYQNAGDPDRSIRLDHRGPIHTRILTQPHIYIYMPLMDWRLWIYNMYIECMNQVRHHCPWTLESSTNYFPWVFLFKSILRFPYWNLVVVFDFFLTYLENCVISSCRPRVSRECEEYSGLRSELDKVKEIVRNVSSQVRATWVILSMTDVTWYTGWWFGTMKFYDFPYTVLGIKIPIENIRGIPGRIGIYDTLC